MAQRPGAARKRAAKRKPKNDQKHPGREAAGILIIALGILIGIAVYSGSGAVLLSALREGAAGAFGLVAYAMPVILAAIGIITLMEYKLRFRTGKLVLSIFLALCIYAMLHMPFYGRIPGRIAYGAYIAECWYMGMGTYTGAGALGGILCWPLVRLLDVAGTWVLLSACTLAVLVALTSLSLRRVGEQAKDRIQTRVHVQAERQAERREQRKRFEHEPAKLVDLSAPGEPPLGWEERYRIEKKEAEPAPGPELLEPVQAPAAEPEWQEPSIQGENPAYSEEPVLDAPRPRRRQPKPEPQPEPQPEPAEEEPPFALDEPDFGEAQVNSVAPQYRFPPVSLLNPPGEKGYSREDAKAVARNLEDVLASFGVSAKVTNVSRGPVITQYELQPAPGVKVNRIVSLADDLALHLAAPTVRIEAPIPGKNAIGIEVPNKESSMVGLREVLESPEFTAHKSKVAVALGKDISGKNIVVDLARMPHLLIAGSTGSGKSVCINSIIVSLLYRAAPQEVQLIMIDPKVVELSGYDGIPHLKMKVVTDPRKAAGALQGALAEMTRRYRLFSESKVKDITRYNELAEQEGWAPLPLVVIIVDELADLMMVAANDVEDAICRLAQMARAAGMHLVIATQRPSVDVITGLIKANIPSRIAFATASQVDSRTILDMAGAEKLLGKGDMLYYPIGANKPIRAQGAFLSEAEVDRVVEFFHDSGEEPHYDEEFIRIADEYEPKGGRGQKVSSSFSDDDMDDGDRDPLLGEAAWLCVEMEQGSVSMIQRKFRVGYTRAGRILDQLADAGVVGPFEGSKARKLIIGPVECQNRFGPKPGPLSNMPEDGVGS